MKFLIYSAISFFSINSFAQFYANPNGSFTSIEERRFWDAQEYIWSHCHLQSSNSDKCLLDYKAIDNWVSFSDQPVSITRNGQYIAYFYGYRNNSFKSLFDTLVLQSTVIDWRQQFTGATSGFFSANNKLYVFKNKEGLHFIGLGSDDDRVVKNVTDSKVPSDGTNEWIAYRLASKELVLENLVTGKQKQFADVVSYTFDKEGKGLFYQLNNGSKDLVVYNLKTESEFRFSFVDKYTFNANGTAMLLQMDGPVKVSGRTLLQYVDLATGKAIPIWQSIDGATISDFQLDGSGKQAVFVVRTGNPITNAIWYWKAGMDKAVMKLNEQSKGIDAHLSIQGNASFTDNNNYIQFYLAPQIQKLEANADASSMDIWNYKDAVLQSTQMNEKDRQIKYTAVFNPQSGVIVQLEKDYELINMFGGSINGDNALILKKSGNDRFWEGEYNDRTYILVSLRNGIRKQLTEKGSAVSFSPNGSYVVYFTRDNGGTYYSYNTQTEKIANISIGAASGQFAYKDIYLRLNGKKAPQNIFVLSMTIGWAGERSILVSDNYDIWLLDLDGIKPPVNLTNGYGKRNHTVFQVSGGGNGITMGSFKMNDTLLLKAFNRQNKYNGFYRKILGSKGDPEKLYMGPCFMENIPGVGGSVNGMAPVKAADADIWILQRQTATEAPNYFLTRDFKEFKPLTDLQPQKKYNWYTTELRRFKQLDGTMGQGILYKPENFDPSKKYPVIVSFYEAGLSDQLHQFIVPQYINCPSIFSEPAWMLSHGYLVFLPDMYFIQGNWGRTTMNSIDGAARYLKTLPYVDAKSIGVGGHSNSGRYSYYLLTHSTFFAAMAIGAGTTDLIDYGLSINKGDGKSALEWYERASSGEGLDMLWDDKAKWLDHTAVLNADKVTSPLLLFHNKNDGVGVDQAVQLYTALRRLGKKAWWLQYDDGLHTVFKLKDLRDFTLRYTQYFDHYLKHAPAPKWMTEGIPAAVKQIESRYELDPSGTCDLPDKKECPVCAAWNKQYKRSPEMFAKPIAEWHLDKDIEEEMERKLTAKWAILDKEEKKVQLETVNIIKNGYPEDRKK